MITGPKLFLSSFIALCLVVPACVGGYRIKTEVGPDGYTETRTVENEIGLEGERDFSEYAIEGIDIDLVGVDRTVFLDAVKRVGPGGKPEYYLRLTYTGPQELHIERRRSLEMSLDSSGLFTLEGAGRATRSQDVVNKTFTERYDYAVPVDVLVRMCEVREIQIVITGRDITLDCYFLDRNFETFRRFVEAYVDPVD